MRILVTGAEEGLGREIAEAGTESGIHVSGLPETDLDGSNRETLRASLAEVAPGLVVHAATWDDVEAAESAPRRALAVNRDRTSRLARACASAGIPLLHLSTAEVFDGRNPAPYTERDGTNPLNVYGRSMLAGEDVVRKRAERHLILRLSWVFGRHRPGFVGTVLRRAREASLLEFADDERGCPTPASAVASAVRRIAGLVGERGFDAWGLYHYAGRRSMTRYAFAREILDRARERGRFRCAVVPVPSARAGRRAPRPANAALEGSKAERRLGLSPPDPDPGLDDVVAALLSGGS